ERPAIAATLKAAENMAEQIVAHNTDESPMFSVLPVQNQMRQETLAKNSPLVETGQMMKNAPAVKGKFFKVASILE
ncbi:Asp-tRNA(Asn)/Glu-tRNA(Gln) amidotransferase GatCAB subunit C, partial [bacterium]|nr:Asp-tRNA(Asn)/Glu-tRNA(Gln) amidotransferase GatCAB subunit C [bacterium]